MLFQVQFGSNNPSGAQSSSKSGSHITVDLDFHSADASFGAVPSDFIVNDDDVADLDMLALLQAHFDSVDFPTGVEAPISLFLDSSQNSKKSKGSSSDMKDPEFSGLKSTQMSSSNPGTVQTPSWPQLLTSQGLAASSQHGLAGQHFASGISTPLSPVYWKLHSSTKFCCFRFIICWSYKSTWSWELFSYATTMGS